MARVRRPLALVLGIWLLLLLAEAAPHLVHHLFDPDGDANCGFLAAADHAPADIAAPLAIPVLLASREGPVAPAPPRLSFGAPPSSSRSPPTPLPFPA